MNKSHFASSQLFSMCSVGDEIEILYQGVNKEGRLLYSQTNEMLDWNNEIPQSLVGQIVLVSVVREAENMIKFLVEGKYNGKIYLEKNDAFFGSKQRARKVKNILKDGDIIHCEVTGFREKPRILELKWIAELDMNILGSEDIVNSPFQDKSAESESKTKRRAKYRENTVKNNIMNNLDIGNRSHWVAVGQNSQDVKEFGVYSQDQLAMCEWLLSKGVTSIAMERTGTYWQNLFSTLIGQGFDVILVNGRQTKTSRGRRQRSKIVSGYKNSIRWDYSAQVFCRTVTRTLSAPIPAIETIC
ncbi:MAG: IS110 family transposase [Prevotellaceae bacterium]|jgi:hypothetical protein|nr:IS110 family transposase [Prevotellaceae bacterium]